MTDTALLAELGLWPQWTLREPPPADVAANGTASAAPQAGAAEPLGPAAASSGADEAGSAAPLTNAVPDKAATALQSAAAPGSGASQARQDEAGGIGDAGTQHGSSGTAQTAEQPSEPAAASLALPGMAGETAQTAPRAAHPDDAARSAVIARLDWDALAQRVKGCPDCRLCETRTHAVFGVGDPRADWLFVGEAPGANEDQRGEPFVGQAGKLLDAMLQALEMDRGRNVFIANVIKCRPPGNRDPLPDEVAQCEPYLRRQIALIQPRVIVALGRFAAQTLLRTDARIGTLRQQVHRYEGVPVIVTYHPAYLLRNLPDKAKSWADLRLARATYRQTLAAGDAPPFGQGRA